MSSTPRPEGPRKKASARVPSVGNGSNRRPLLIAGAAGIVAVVLVLAYLLLGSGSSSGSAADPTKQLEAAGCTVKAVAALPGSDHSVITPEGTSVKWNTDPPTNGPHYANPAIWGAYTDSLLPAQVVHNLEHGGIFIQYGKAVPQATVDELKGFYDAHQEGTLLAPLPRLGSKIALGAWTTTGASATDKGTAYVVKCAGFDEAAYAAFFKAYQFKGPERFPVDLLLPGS